MKNQPRKKSTLTIILILAAILGLTSAVLLAPGCSPVVLEIKFLALEVHLLKGECQGKRI